MTPFRLFKKKKRLFNLDPDEVFLDSSNIPNYDVNQFEGRIEKPLGRKAFFILGVFFSVIFFAVIVRSANLDILNFNYYNQRSANNRLKKEAVFAYRGIITDRDGVNLAWNEPSPDSSTSERKYIKDEGFSLLLGFVKYPKKDSSGFFYENETTGQDGVEKYFNNSLTGKNGVKLTEVDASGKIISQSVLDQPEQGGSVALSIDSGLQNALYLSLKSAASKSGFLGGAAVIMDSKTGEILASVSYPEYDSQIMTDGTDSATINSYFKSIGKPSLDRVVYGLFAPGSTIKPFLALAALNEKIIDPSKKILSTGALTVPNPYNPSKPNIFKDWKVNGWTNMQEAIAVSSDVYFYEIGGGFKGQEGLGITRIDTYLKSFLFGSPTSDFYKGPNGNIPTPDWKKKNFGGEEWLLGDTYHTAIGQYGTQVTPLQLARAMTGIANGGFITEPVILKGETGKRTYLPDISQSDYDVVRGGMRLAVTNGTAIALNVPGIKVAAKTGTAQVGANNELVHSWVNGFFPYDNPRYTFALVLERGPTTYQVSAMRAMTGAISWIATNAPQYINGTSTAIK
ncbi:MAG: penicillin-binding transpeptidase domain-containing protein [Candidatus Paceibacterota bacterium]